MAHLVPLLVFKCLEAKEVPVQIGKLMLFDPSRITS